MLSSKGSCSGKLTGYSSRSCKFYLAIVSVRKPVFSGCSCCSEKLFYLAMLFFLLISS